MTQDRLDRNQLERVEEKYREHPLYCACYITFRNYQARMRHLMFSPVEVFVEAVNVIDDLLEEGSDKLEYIQNLWESLLIRYKQWYIGAPDDEEYNMAVSSVLYTVAIVLSRHQDDYYSVVIKDAILNEIDTHISIVKQEENHVLISLSRYAGEIESLLDSYTISDSYFSDEIDDVIHGRKPRVQFTTTNKPSKPNNKKTQNPAYSKYSFKLTGIGRFEGKEDFLLQWLHTELKTNNFVEDFKQINLGEELSHIVDIKERNKIVFNAVFSGADTEYHIIWKGSAKELGYFINQLEARGVLSWKKGPRKWQVTRFRIWKRTQISEASESSGKRIVNYTYEPFEKKAFNGSLVPADTTKLDSILNMIAPPVEKNGIRGEIEKEFRDNANFEEDNDNDRGEILSGAFRDTSHKSME